MKSKLKRVLLKAAALTMAFSFVMSSTIFAGNTDSVYYAEDGKNEISDNATIYIVGDSTACEYGYDENYAIPRAGWGMYLSKYISENRNVVNLALGGRSSKSFTTEENYRMLKENLKEGDCLLIQFGHNDAKNSTEEDLKNRYTDPAGDIGTEGSFKNSLYENYIKLAREKGAVPVLISPVSRRKFDEKGRVTDSHGLYDDAVEDLADETGVKFIDMTIETERLYNAFGTEITKAFHAAYKDKTKGIDNTHYNAYGANIVALKIASGLGMDVDYQETVVTRGEFIEGLIRVIGETEKSEGEIFIDVPPSYKYADSIAAAKKMGITNGDTNGRFRPDEPLKAYDAIIFIMRTLKYAGIEYSNVDIDNVMSDIDSTDEDINNIKENIKLYVPDYAANDCINFVELANQIAEYILKTSKADIGNGTESSETVWLFDSFLINHINKDLPVECEDALFITLYELISDKEKTETSEQDLNEIEKVENTK